MGRKTSRRREPGLLKRSFALIFKNAGVFLPLILVAAGLGLLTIGASEDTQVIIAVLAILLVWMVTLFLARHLVAGEKVKFADGMYGATAPLVSTLLILLLAVVQSLPIILIVISYAAAVETGLFNDFFYLSLYVLFVIAMVIAAAYLLSGTIVALIAVTTPAIRPVEALKLSYELIGGQRTRFLLKSLRMVAAAVGVAVILVGPMILINLAVSAPWLIMIMGYVAASFAVMLAAVYWYLDYREMLGFTEEVKK